MNRREFLRDGGLAFASSALLLTSNRCHAASRDRTAKMKRIGCTTVCFRMRFPSTRPKNHPKVGPDLTLMDVPAFFAKELDVHNVELWSRHFEDTSLKYCKKIKAVAQSVGSKIINIQLDEPAYNLSHRDPAARKKSIEFVKQWMERAAACGATSLRANTGGSPKEKFDVNITGDSYRQLAEYGQKIGVKILIENHGGHSTKPENIVQIIKAVDSPYCRTLPDFGNVPKKGGEEYRYKLLKMLFPYAHLVSAKGMYFDDQMRHVSYDIGACVRIGKSLGFKGIYSAEQWTPKLQSIDPVKITKRIIELVVENI